jgi:hypothetical protein
MHTVYLYRFRYFDSMHDEWMTARYAAAHDGIPNMS